jgi:hypothetical protein
VAGAYVYGQGRVPQALGLHRRQPRHLGRGRGHGRPDGGSRQLFTYRVGEPITTPATRPSRSTTQFTLEERVTGDSYYHRRTSINSTLNMRDGVWTYSLGSHWIGDSITGTLIKEAATVVPNVAAVLAGWGLL